MKLLVAEDDRISAALFEAILEADGHQVTIVRNGNEALAALERESFDAIVTDWLMPKMDGLQFVRTVRQTRRHGLPIVVVTALASEEARSEAIDAGANDFLPKPFRPHELVDLLRTWFPTRNPSTAEQSDTSGELEPSRVSSSLTADSVYVRESLYPEFQPLVRRLISQYGGTPDVREDLEGEIYVQFVRLLQSFDPSRGIPFRAYVVSNLSRMIYTHMRGQWRRARRETLLDPDAEHALQDEQDPIGDLTRSLSEEGTRIRMRQALRGLPKRQRHVVVRRYYEGRDYTDIANELGVKPATVRSLLRHALNRVRQDLGVTPAPDTH